MRDTILCGDALAMLSTLPSNHVQTCVTSPPYYSLRDYGVEGQIGLEDTPEAYIARLVEVFREVRRVLRTDGTCWINIGDSYANDGKWGGMTGGKHVEELHGMEIGRRRRYTGLKPKDLIGIPWMLAFALRADGWYLRSDVIWHKPNCMPESVTDRPTSAHEHVFLLAKSASYFYDADAIREPHTDVPHTRGANTVRGRDDFGKGKGSGWATFADGTLKPTFHNPAGRNKRNVWTIASHPYSEAHFATMPPKLVEPCILAGSRPGDIVLDCFMGAGTVALVALQHNRSYLGIELNPAYCDLIKERISEIQPELWSA